MNYISVQFFKIYFYLGYPTLNSTLSLCHSAGRAKRNTYLKVSLNNTQYQVETNYELLNIKHEVLFF